MTTAQMDFEYDLMSIFGFFGNQRYSGYKLIGGHTILRIKDHEANYAYFIEDIENNDSIVKVISVNYTGNVCKNPARTTIDEIRDQFPNIEFVEINFDFESTEIDDAVAIINNSLKS